MDVVGQTSFSVEPLVLLCLDLIGIQPEEPERHQHKLCFLFLVCKTWSQQTRPSLVYSKILLHKQSDQPAHYDPEESRQPGSQP